MMCHMKLYLKNSGSNQRKTKTAPDDCCLSLSPRKLPLTQYTKHWQRFDSYMFAPYCVNILSTIVAVQLHRPTAS